MAGVAVAVVVVVAAVVVDRIGSNRLTVVSMVTTKPC